MLGLQLLIYNIVLGIYKIAISIASICNTKAKQMLLGRQHLLKNILQNHKKNKHTVWMHCASVGEYEQGLPLLKVYKAKHAQSRIVLTFFSPSGFNSFKQNNIVDEVFYLPLDSKKNAIQFVNIIEPAIVFFVKYELWYYYLHEIFIRKIPIYMISMYLPQHHIFNKWYGSLHRKMLHFFTTIFLQDDSSYKALEALGFKNLIVTGDTRYDRMQEISNTAFKDGTIEQFCGQKKILIAGSTWPKDEELIAKWWYKFDDKHNWKLIIVPHQLSDNRIAGLHKLFKENIQLYTNSDVKTDVLIVNTIGILSRIYRFATITYIGGGFGAGIHNILEPLSYGKAVICGPNTSRFLEVKTFTNIDALAIIGNENNLMEAVTKFANNRTENEKQIISQILIQKGAVNSIMDKL